MRKGEVNPAKAIAVKVVILAGAVSIRSLAASETGIAVPKSISLYLTVVCFEGAPKTLVPVKFKAVLAKNVLKNMLPCIAPDINVRSPLTEDRTPPPEGGGGGGSLAAWAAAGSAKGAWYLENIKFLV